jgi:octaprenyl-diphosphate synthase
MDFNSLYARYESDLKEVERSLLELFKSNASLIPAIGQYIVKGGGKRIRPLFLLASTDIFGYKKKNRIELASIIEAIHTASLIHDDIVDSAQIRRGQPTANAVWSNQIVVLVGDFLYSNALKAAVFQKNQLIMEHLSRATTRMTEGELLQLSRISDPAISEGDYLDIIAGKTGALISAACSLGAIASGADSSHVEALAAFGMKTGMAFQMADDILDYAANETDFGKNLGKDLEEGKITLPIIELLIAANEAEAGEIRDIIASETNAEPGVQLNRMFELLRKYNTINISMQKASRLIDEAKSELKIFDRSPGIDTLNVLAEYALVREK